MVYWSAHIRESASGVSLRGVHPSVSLLSAFARSLPYICSRRPFAEIPSTAKGSLCRIGASPRRGRSPAGAAEGVVADRVVHPYKSDRPAQAEQGQQRRRPVEHPAGEAVAGNER